VKILLDTNVVLDLLLSRTPFMEEVREIFILTENKEVDGYLCATTVTTLHYLVEKERNTTEANEIIEMLLKLFEVTEVNKAVLQSACIQNGIDYEDAVIYSSCEINSIDYIITRDKRGFANAKTPVLTPKEFLAFYTLT